MTNRQLASRIKVGRARRGMTQEQLAQRAGLSYGYLARLEIAYHNPSLSTLRKLAKALGVKIGQLVE